MQVPDGYHTLGASSDMTHYIRWTRLHFYNILLITLR